MNASELMDLDMQTRIDDYSKITVESGCIILNYVYPYEIDLRRANTPAKILGWADHLGEKNWMTKQRLMYFLQIAFAQIGIEIDRGM